MRLALLLAGSLSAGAVGISQGVIPLPPQMAQAITALGGDPAQLGKTINFNPVAAYNEVLPQILKGHTPEELGFHTSVVTIPPGSFSTMNNAVSSANLSGQNGLATSMAGQMQQNFVRMQDAATYARNPAGWHGPLPH